MSEEGTKYTVLVITDGINELMNERHDMQKLIMMKGLPASGKTTLAKIMVNEAQTNTIKRVNKDDLRDMLDSSKWSKGNEDFVLKARDEIILAALNAGKSVISDDTNFEPKHEARLRALAKIPEGRNIKFEVKFIDVDVETCVQRNLRRIKPVPESVIRSMHRKFLKDTEAPPPPPPVLEDKPWCIVVDLDGTLAHMVDRGPYEPLKAASDKVDETLNSLLWFYEDAGYDLVFVSARDGSGYDVAHDWLIEKGGFMEPNLIMRDAGDNRKDAIVKEEIYETCIKPNYNVHLVFDDRDQVVSMWRSKGLTCYQVADGNF